MFFRKFFSHVSEIKLFKLANKILNLDVNVVPAEKMFSTFGSMQTNARSNLSMEYVISLFQIRKYGTRGGIFH